jgi:hypothetical protein
VAINENGRSDDKEGQLEDFGDKGYCSLKYSALACCRRGCFGVFPESKEILITVREGLYEDAFHRRWLE